MQRTRQQLKWTSASVAERSFTLPAEVRSPSRAMRATANRSWADRDDSPLLSSTTRKLLWKCPAGSWVASLLSPPSALRFSF